MISDRETEMCTRCRLNGVFIDELPQEFVYEILSRFQKKSICCYNATDVGLTVYFNTLSQAIEVACRGSMINVQGTHYNISLAQTSLTIHGIATYTKDIGPILTQNGFKGVAHFYEVCGKKCKSFGALVDFRVILEIPEIYNIKNYKKIQWNENYFEVSFFCQFCRLKGHKAFDCSGYSQSKEVADSYIINERGPDVAIASTSQQDQQLSNPFPTAHVTSPHLLPNVCTTSAAPQNPFPNVVCSTSAVQKILPKTRKEQKSVTSSTRRKRRKKERKISLSKKMEKAALTTTGVLSPKKLIIFLKEVKGRKDKKLMESAALQSEGNIPELILQLQSVLENYYMLAKRKRPDEERDIAYIKNLLKRLKDNLEQQIANGFQEQLASSRLTNERS